MFNLNKNEVQKIQSFCLNLRDDMESKIESLQGDIISKFGDLSRRLGVIEAQEAYKVRIIEEQKSFITDIHSENELNKLHIEDIKERMAQLEKKIIEKEDFSAFKIRTERDYHIVLRHIVDIEERLKKTQNFIDKQIPLDYTKSMAEMIDFSTNDNLLKMRLQEYMKTKLDIFKQQYVNNKGWADRPTELDELNDDNFVWVPNLSKYQSRPVSRLISPSPSGLDFKNYIALEEPPKLNNMTQETKIEQDAQQHAEVSQMFQQEDPVKMQNFSYISNLEDGGVIQNAKIVQYAEVVQIAQVVHNHQNM
jgi:hypothetical protein